MTTDDLLLHLRDEIGNLLLSCVFYLFIRLLHLNWGLFSINIDNIRVGTLKVRIEARLSERWGIRLCSHCCDSLDLSKLTILCIDSILVRFLLLHVFLLFRSLECIKLVSFLDCAIELRAAEVARPCLVLDQRRLRIDHRGSQVHSLLLRRFHIAVSIDEFDSFPLLLQLSYQLTDCELLNRAGFASR